MKMSVFAIAALFCVATFAQSKKIECAEVDQKAVGKIVEDSQRYEYFTLYKSPKVDADLSKYWDKGGSEAAAIRKSLKRFTTNGWHYGKGTALDQFSVDEVSFFADDSSAGNACEATRYAKVTTTEDWDLHAYSDPDDTVEAKYAHVGPYQVQYDLVKDSTGHWLISSSTTLRAQ